MSDDSARMRVSIRLFATLRDRAGVDQTEIELPNGAHVADLLPALAAKYPLIEPGLSTAMVAINQEYAFPDDKINPGDEVALFPPVSGGSETEAPDHFAVTTEQLDLDAICSAITIPETGAVCVFSGAVRGSTSTQDGVRSTDHLYYEAYQPMAEKTLRQIALEIRRKFPGVQGVAIVQRIGELHVGETTILVACSAGHRNGGCFEGARYGIDRVKEIVPVWKKEFGSAGEEWVEGHYRPTPTDTGRDDKSKSAIQASNDGSEFFALACPECGESYDANFDGFKCHCGGALEFAKTPTFDRVLIDANRFDLWRYKRFLTPDTIGPITLGEGWTPMIETIHSGRPILLKLESMNPTGSFKDRGAAVLVSVLKAQDTPAVYDDSSGNAGAALAAYAARAGMQAKLYVPASAAPQKLAQIRVYGATLETVDGPRSEAAKAAEAAFDRGERVYASHIWNPFSVFAHRTIAYEIWEQLRGNAPHTIVVPLGHGSQLLGMAAGFEELLQAGLISQVPRLIGVQAAACAPIYESQQAQVASSELPTLAEGIRIIHPIRAKRVLQAITRSLGAIVAVDEQEIVGGIAALAHEGVLAEPTSAVVWAGLARVMSDIPEGAKIVLTITGSGQKTYGIDKLVAQHAVI